MADVPTSLPSTSAYYAWSKDKEVRKKELEALGVDHSPKPVASPTATAASTTAGSAWNSAGTFEQREVSSKATSLLREHCTAFTATTTVGDMRCKSATATGECSVIFARGRARVGFEIAVKMTVLCGAAEATIALQLEDSDSDMFSSPTVTVTKANGLDAAAVKKALLSLQGQLRSGLFEPWREAVKQL